MSTQTDKAPALLERDAELATIEQLLAEARSGEGALLVVEGPAGAGKTSLLRAAAAAGRTRGMQVFDATGSELERELGFGIVRELFESVLARSDEERRRSLLAGAARFATPVFSSASAGAPAIEPEAALHGLYWLASNLATEDPVLLVVDDAQWADGSSLRFLAYLTRRLSGMPLMLIVAMRPSEPGGQSELLAALTDASDGDVLLPAPLSEAGVERLIAARFARPVAPEFVTACHVATGGNPFLVGELLTALQIDNVAPTAASAANIGRIAPQTVSRSVFARVAWIGPEARALIEAFAVLGGGELRQAMALADLQHEVAADALDALTEIGVLRSSRPIRFIHPLVRAAVDEGIPPARRSLMHGAAARLLVAESADPDRVALHLLNAEPQGEEWVVQALRAAARDAAARGASEQAADYLRRAMREPPATDERAGVLHELGAAELLVRDPAATEHLSQALDATDDPEARAAVALLLGRAAVGSGRLAEARELLGVVIDEIGEAQPEAVARLEAYRSAGGVWDPRFGAELERDRPRLQALAELAGPAGRSLSLMLAFRSAFDGGRREEIVGLVENGLDGGRLLEDESAEAIEITWAARALIFIDELDLADRLLDEMVADSRKRGSVMGYATASAWRADVGLRRGAIAAAEADARSAIDLAVAHGLYFITPHAHSFLGEALIEVGEVEEASALLEHADLGPMQGSRPEVRFLRTRARARLAMGDQRGAIEDLRACQAQQTWFRNPNQLEWRCTLALALPEGSRDEALALVDEDLERARELGQARAIGVALRAKGVLCKGEEQLSLLSEAVDALEDCPSQLERARALTDLGSALRRASTRREAKDVLSRAMDLAAGCGAAPLAARARAELVTAGARPRRARSTGLDALTESERRVAQMAASGITNREIAESIFVTMKTVALHLTRVYQKLGITGRAELSEALDERPKNER